MADESRDEAAVNQAQRERPWRSDDLTISAQRRVVTDWNEVMKARDRKSDGFTMNPDAL